METCFLIAIICICSPVMCVSATTCTHLLLQLTDCSMKYPLPIGRILSSLQTEPWRNTYSEQSGCPHPTLHTTTHPPTHRHTHTHIHTRTHTYTHAHTYSHTTHPGMHTHTHTHTRCYMYMYVFRDLEELTKRTVRSAHETTKSEVIICYLKTDVERK